MDHPVPNILTAEGQARTGFYTTYFFHSLDFPPEESRKRECTKERCKRASADCSRMLLKRNEQKKTNVFLESVLTNRDI